MKKILLSTLALSLCIGSFAQNSRQGKPLSSLKVNHSVKPVPLNKIAVTGNEMPAQTINSNVVSHPKNKLTSNPQTPIGNSTYDLQSNGSPDDRFAKVGNNLSASWTFSTDLAGTYPDRGSAINYSTDNGVTWGPAPTARIETVRTGWPCQDILGNGGEYVISHQGGFDMRFNTRPTFGTGSWTETTIPSAAASAANIWPRTVAGGSNGNSIHLISITYPVANGGAIYNGLDGALIYSRSEDAGATWNILNSQLPGSDSSVYSGYRADGYAIDANGSTIAIAAADLTEDWAIWKSTDNGTTWTKTIVLDFPFTHYDDLTQITDIDSDGIADTIVTSDGAVSVLVDNNGLVHTWSGAMRVFDDDPTAAIGLFLDANGLMYWNESMGANPPVVIATSPDLDADGLVLSFAANWTTCRYGNDGLCSMPSSGVDAFNNIYVTYNCLMELTDDGALGCSYRNTFAMASTDGGNTWLTPFNASNSIFDEAVFASMARNVDNPGCLHVIWQQDGSPGTSVPPNGVGSIANNDFIYSCIDVNTELGVPLSVADNIPSQVSVSVAPNPASDFVALTYTLNKSVSIEVDIFNVHGQKVDHITANNVSGTQILRVKTDQYSAGIYSVTSKIGENVYTNKFVVKN